MSFAEKFAYSPLHDKCSRNEISMVTHSGGCHCGRVRFEVVAPTILDVDDCNCSVCKKAGYLHLIVAANQFRLVSGHEALTTYTFGTHTAKHYFCTTCGVKSFYIPRSHPDGVSVNVHCIDSATIEGMSVTPFDGHDWETGRARRHERDGGPAA